MELSETLRTRVCELNLQWVPRDLNQLADDLTNQKFDSFPSDKRIQFVGGDTKLLVLDSLMHKAQEFYEELAREKKREISNPKPKGANKKKKIDPWWILVCKGIEMLLGKHPGNKVV